MWVGFLPKVDRAITQSIYTGYLRRIEQLFKVCMVVI